MTKVDAAKIKAFLTRTTDRFRPPYGRRVIEVPRQCVFAGSTNTDNYLRDPTGGRRFWPVRVGKIDLDGLATARDQLWAEAAHHHRAGSPWWLDDPALITEAREEQGARYAGDPWDALLTDYVADRDQITMPEIMTAALDLPKARWTPQEQARIKAILQSLGFERRQVRAGHRRSWQYVWSGSSGEAGQRRAGYGESSDA